jgi:hypothetical protein
MPLQAFPKIYDFINNANSSKTSITIPKGPHKMHIHFKSMVNNLSNFYHEVDHSICLDKKIECISC